MDIRQAILKAPDSIERRPDLLSFIAFLVPNDCGTPACTLGWIGFHLGMHGKGVESEVHPAMGLGNIIETDNRIFYKRMQEIIRTQTGKITFFSSAKPSEIVPALRIYADKYHPETNHIPECILDIVNFETA